MNNQDELRSVACEVRASDENDTFVIEGKPAVYGKYTDMSGFFQEVIEPGAFDQADMSDIIFVVNHDSSTIPLARSRANSESTMNVIKTSDGLEIRASLDVKNNPKAAELYSAVKRGDISGMSYRYRVDEDRWDNIDSNYPTRHILKVKKIIDVSAVTFPAYKDTEIYARSRNMAENAKKEIEQQRKKAEMLKLEKVKALALF